MLDSDSTLQIPLAILNSLQAPSKLSIQLSDGQEFFHLLLWKDLEGEFFHINYISKNQNNALTVSNALKTIQFINAGSDFSFILDSETPKLQGNLKKSNKYTLTTHIIEPYSHISPSSASRFLFECSDGTFEIDGMCVRVCPTKFYKENNVCRPCTEECGLCLSNSQCNNCQGITYFDSATQTCVSECPEGYFQDYNNRICVQCSEGCLKCNFPDGECTSSSFKRDMIINLIICLVMVALITLCAYYCNKEAPEEQSQPPQSQEENQTKEKSNQEVPESVQRARPRKGSNLLGPYNMLYEDADVPEDAGEEDHIPSRRKKKRLTNFAKSKLLNISMSKPFEVDDGNQDKAISHDSACKFFSTSASPMIGKSRFDLSPMIFSKSPLLSSYAGAGTGRNLLSSSNMDDQKQQQNEKQEKQDQKAIKTRSILFNMEDSPLKKARENLKRQAHASDEKKDGTPLALSSIKVDYHQFDTNEDEKEEPQKEDDEKEIKEVSEPEKDENTEGYKPDLSISSFVDRDDFEDLSSCTICGMNKRDCVIQPCRHTVACYACMEQFKESYGVCPRCQKMVTGLQKFNNK